MTDEDHVEQATTFDAEKAPQGNRFDGTESYYNHYKRLALANDSRFNGKWVDREQQTKKNSSAIVDAIAGQLELTDYQKSESHREFSNLPDEFNDSRSTAMVALCVCAIVANRDGRGYHPTDVQSTKDTDVSRVVEDIGIHYGRFRSCWIDVERVIE